MASRTKEKDPLRAFVEDLTNCSICFDQMEQPKHLNCGHAFCLQCLRKNFTTQRRRTDVECALCRELTKLPPNGLDGLKSFFVAVQAKDSLDKANRAATTPSRHMCFIHKKVLNVWCTVCSDIICDNCSTNEHSQHYALTLKEADDLVDILFKESLKENSDYKTQIDQINDYKKILLLQKDDSVKNAIRQAKEDYDRRLQSIKREADEVEKRNIEQLDATLKNLERSHTISTKITDEFQRESGGAHQKLLYLTRFKSGSTRDLQNATTALRPIFNQPDPFAKGMSSGDVSGVTSDMQDEMKSLSISVIQDVFQNYLQRERSNAIVRKMNDRYGNCWNCFIGKESEISHGFESQYTFEAKVDGNLVILSKTPSVDDKCFPKGTVFQPEIIGSSGSVDMETSSNALTVLRRCLQGGCMRNDIVTRMRSFGARGGQHQDLWQCIVSGGPIVMRKARSSSKHILIRIGQERILLFQF